MDRERLTETDTEEDRKKRAGIATQSIMWQGLGKGSGGKEEGNEEANMTRSAACAALAQLLRRCPNFFS